MQLSIIEIHQANITPVVGLAATYHIGSDSYPFTIVSVSASGKSFVMQQDTARGSGVFSLNKEGRTMKVYRNIRGEWKISKKPYAYVTVGCRQLKMDPHF